MSDDIGASQIFGSATLQGIDSSNAVVLPGQTQTATVSALIYDDLVLRAGGKCAARAWRVAVVAVPLKQPSRRRIQLMLRGGLTVVGAATARVSVHCEGRRGSLELRRQQAAAPSGGLALDSRDRDVAINLCLPRSTRPRSELRLQLFLEADAVAATDEASAFVETIDIKAA